MRLTAAPVPGSPHARRSALGRSGIILTVDRVAPVTLGLVESPVRRCDQVGDFGGGALPRHCRGDPGADRAGGEVPVARGAERGEP